MNDRFTKAEIEGALERHPAVKQALVMVREDQPGDKRLVAYVVSSQEPYPTIGELRTFLKVKLPDYMIPSAFVMMEELQLTPHGKVDRATLLAPKAARSELAKSIIEPRDSTEEILAEIWSQVLGIDKVGIQDDFFELGGHSLLATRLISKIRNAFSIELPLHVLFEAPTVATLAAAIKNNNQPQQKIIPIPRYERSLNQLLQEVELLSESDVRSTLNNLKENKSRKIF
jgi:acyl carrier protein